MSQIGKYLRRKKRGPGCPRRRFGDFFAEEKVTRGVGAGSPHEVREEWQFFGGRELFPSDSIIEKTYRTEDEDSDGTEDTVF